jgi:transcriptional regulator with XRE-family HTH domain
MSIGDKIKLLIEERNLTPSHFADEIGVQRSSISHIMAGRNRPSLEIVQKIVTRFPDITYEWLLEEPLASPENRLRDTSYQRQNRQVSKTTDAPMPNQQSAHPVQNDSQLRAATVAIRADKSSVNGGGIAGEGRTIEKILIFYSDKTFTEYNPTSGKDF